MTSATLFGEPIQPAPEPVPAAEPETVEARLTYVSDPSSPSPWSLRIGSGAVPLARHAWGRRQVRTPSPSQRVRALRHLGFEAVTVGLAAEPVWSWCEAPGSDGSEIFLFATVQVRPIPPGQSGN